MMGVNSDFKKLDREIREYLKVLVGTINSIILDTRNLYDRLETLSSKINGLENKSNQVINHDTEGN